MPTTAKHTVSMPNFPDTRCTMLDGVWIVYYPRSWNNNKLRRLLSDLKLISTPYRVKVMK